VALDERTRRYFERLVQHPPSGGEIVFFDQSWYDRAAVERVMGFCNDNEVREIFRSAPGFRRLLIRSGIQLFGFSFSVSKAEQARRFEARPSDSLEQWKLSPVDLESQQRRDAYTRAEEDMFFSTSTADPPWSIVKSDDKRQARIGAIRVFLRVFAYPGRRDELSEVDPRTVRTLEAECGVEDRGVARAAGEGPAPALHWRRVPAPLPVSSGGEPRSSRGSAEEDSLASAGRPLDPSEERVGQRAAPLRRGRGGPSLPASLGGRRHRAATLRSLGCEAPDGRRRLAAARPTGRRAPFVAEGRPVGSAGRAVDGDRPPS